MLHITNLNSRTATIDFQQFAKGLYFVKTETKDGRSMTKRIILK